MNRFLPLVRVVLWGALAGWAGTIIYLSSLSGKELQKIEPFALWDKAAHALAFAVGGVLAAASLRASTRWPKWGVWAAAVLLLALFGGSDEYHQLTTPGRSGGDLYDWLADVIGASAGAALLLACWRDRPSLKPLPAHS